MWQNGICSRVLDLGAVPAADLLPAAQSIRSRPTKRRIRWRWICAASAVWPSSPTTTRSTDEPRGVEPQALKDQAADAVARVAEAGWLHGNTVLEFGSPHGGSWLPLLTSAGSRPPRRQADVVLDCFGIMHEPDQRAAFADGRGHRAGGVLLLQYHATGTIVDAGPVECAAARAFRVLLADHVEEPAG